jgi:hypothetical protein
MKCTDFEDRLNELLDDRRAPQDDAALQAHAETCSECREMLLAQESLFRGVALLQRRTPAPELGKRVLRELNAPAPALAPLPSPSRRSWLPMLAAAAAVLLAVGFSIWLVNRGNQTPNIAQPRDRGAHPEGLAIGTPGKRVNPKQNESLVPPPQVTVKQPLVVSPQTLPPQTKILTPEEHEQYRQAMASLATQLSTSAQWPQIENIDMEHYAPGIRPIRESFGVALEALLRTIPSGKKDSPQTPPQALQPYGGMTDLA